MQVGADTLGIQHAKRASEMASEVSIETEWGGPWGSCFGTWQIIITNGVIHGLFQSFLWLV